MQVRPAWRGARSWSRPLVLLALATAVLAAACSSIPGIGGSPRPAAPPGLGAFYTQHLSWHDCTGGQCATMRVPLDYAGPGGRTIAVAVFRAPATGSSAQGSLIVNPGGPGASGVQFAQAIAKFLPSSVRQRFNVVGFDPRGVGGSTPVQCLSDAQLDAYTQGPAAPLNTAQQTAMVTQAQQLAAGCKAKSGAQLTHVSTEDAARDMDVLRAVLGDAKLTYYGASYGTFMGALYAELFPNHVRALVLDSALDPSLSADQQDSQQAVSFEQLLQLFEQWCSSRAGCPLGNSPAAAGQQLDALMARVAANPLPGSGPRVVGSGPFATALASAMYSPDFGFPRLETALAAAMGGDGSQLLAMADEENGRNADGHYDNLLASNVAINCVDRPHPSSVAAIAAQATADAAQAPHFGAANAWSELPCAFWPAPAQISPHRIAAKGTPPLLIVAGREDPATPYQWGVALSHELSNAELLTSTAPGHGAFLSGLNCVDGAVSDYLTNLRLPADGTSCSR